VKCKAFVRELEQAGCILHRHGKRHDIYRNPANGRHLFRGTEKSLTPLCELIRK
jgi:hypothetical protein